MSPSRQLRRLARLAFNLLVYPIARLWPRSPRRWALGHSGDLFAGNPKYLFLWLRLHRPDIRAVWITGSAATARLLRRHGLPVVRRGSPAGIAAALRSQVYAFSHDPGDVDLAFGRGALQLNLWHGVGLKALHTGRRDSSGLRAWLASFVYLPYDTVVSTSPMMQAHFAAQFRLTPERCPQLGYPQLDCAADPALAQIARRLDADTGFAFNPDGHREVYIYLPTYRDTGRPFFETALPDPDALAAALEARGAMLYVKPHPRTADSPPLDHPLIRRWPDEIDFYAYLRDFTGLITDYSSVLYDYLAVKRTGAIIYAFDFDDYTNRDRTLLYPFQDNVAGVRVNTFKELCDVMRSGVALRSSGGVDALRARFWGGSPSPSSQAVVAYAEQRMSARKSSLREMNA